MGLSLKKIGKGLKKVFKPLGRIATAIVPGLQPFAPLFAPRQQFAPVSAGIPALQFPFPMPQIFPQAFPMARAAPAEAAAGLPAVIGMSRNVAMAIGRLATRLGIAVTVTTLGRVGARMWRSLIQFLRRHPNIDAIAFLVSLGLTVEEAAEFFMWGQTKVRRRRRRGISARDLAVCRRTIRRMAAFNRDLGAIRPRARGRVRGRDGMVIAQN